MNAVVVHRLNPRSHLQGLCSYVLESVDNAADRGVVIGHDHRHHSSRWARLTAAAFIDRGVKVYLLKGLVHTPMYDGHRILSHSELSLTLFQGSFRCQASSGGLWCYDYGES